ncbi:metallophosphoesterase family protein [Chitinophaga sancti]|uniref:Calcineurin-like phosphoesterase n=1 Tax=Chitinophaga sancti TaxID=1004 RepID=A0A1K1S3V9_9BACT|nr:metallophosphoesterase [Chitinophaga sancti]WQD63762.1 metallophosphoesterase [Chitinophaga sancti]WQG90613.1 metallophosphoesterase [Chitinophaga sancti]SFW78998.1 Calcineurin-like phosphoesterase [Chitinophaga sancti]
MKYSTPVQKKDQPDDSYKFQPLPAPTGTFPYHLDLRQLIPEISHQQMTFHLVGDTGSLRSTDFQRKVITAMEAQFEQDNPPQFLFHLGDVVYNHGEASQYYRQFFGPFQNYPAPIFAIAGNHDSDVNPAAPPYHSLEHFVTVFCDTTPQTVPFSNNAARKSMVQPNVYWTLKTPLANIIGMHSNVPKFGIVTPGQQEWLKGELRSADAERPGKALIICIHHAPYSADTNHGASIPMITLLEEIFEETGIRPDIVFSGHVHNYQRLVKKYKSGKDVCYVVAGGGGYDELHPIAELSDKRFTNELPVFEGVSLEKYCYYQHGFLKFSIEKQEGQLLLSGNYYSVADDGVVTHEDHFEIKT